jgi:hypothetical protein
MQYELNFSLRFEHAKLVHPICEFRKKPPVKSEETGPGKDGGSTDLRIDAVQTNLINHVKQRDCGISG